MDAYAFVAYLFMVGALYGTSLYIRDLVRMFRRWRIGGPAVLWPPDPWQPNKDEDKNDD